MGLIRGRPGALSAAGRGAGGCAAAGSAGSSSPVEIDCCCVTQSVVEEFSILYDRWVIIALGGPFPKSSKPFLLFLPGRTFLAFCALGVRRVEFDDGWIDSRAAAGMLGYGRVCGRALAGSRLLGVEMVLADCVRMCSLDALVMLLVLAASSEACEDKGTSKAWRLSWPCIALGETTTGTVDLMSTDRYVGNLDAVCSLRASGGNSIAR